MTCKNGCPIHPRKGTVDRRSLFKGAAAMAAAATVGGAVAAASPAGAANSVSAGRWIRPLPKPIPGGFSTPDGSVFHVYVPGPTGVNAPFNGFPLDGIDAEPSLISDFKGDVAFGITKGTATYDNGMAADVETDIRLMQGEYFDVNGDRQYGSFMFL